MVEETKEESVNIRIVLIREWEELIIEASLVAFFLFVYSWIFMSIVKMLG